LILALLFKKRKFMPILVIITLNFKGMLHNLLFGDEAKFHVNGQVSPANHRIWAAHDPEERQGVLVCSPGVMVFMAMTSEMLFGPYFIDGSVNQGKYLEVIRYK
jgi:hypothetical protein